MTRQNLKHVFNIKREGSKTFVDRQFNRYSLGEWFLDGLDTGGTPLYKGLDSFIESQEHDNTDDIHADATVSKIKPKISAEQDGTILLEFLDKTGV